MEFLGLLFALIWAALPFPTEWKVQATVEAWLSKLVTPFAKLINYFAEKWTPADQTRLQRLVRRMLDRAREAVADEVAFLPMEDVRGFVHNRAPKVLETLPAGWLDIVLQIIQLVMSLCRPNNGDDVPPNPEPLD